MTYNFKNLKSKKAFTLVELAIVLVIIGLIVSSVLVGQDLIKAAELRATVRQLDQFQAGVNTFIGKYGQIPGDAAGSKFGLADGDADSNGNEDGNFDGSTTTKLDEEIANFWAHLTTPGRELIAGGYDGDDATAAQQIDDIGTDVPPVKANTGVGWGVFSDGSNNYFIAGVKEQAVDAEYDTVDAFVPLDAFNLDSKIDDGIPTSGSIQARDGQILGAPDTGSTATVVATYSNTTVDAVSCKKDSATAGKDQYQFSATAQLCVLRFDMATF